MKALFGALILTVVAHGQPQPAGGVIGSGSGGGAGIRAPQTMGINGMPVAAEVPPVKPEERCTLEGDVRSSTTAEPLKKANLTLRRSDPSPSGSGLSYAGVSDSAGHFLITDVEPGRYMLMVDRTGYVRQSYGSKGMLTPGTQIILTKAQKVKDINFNLIPQGVITGRVLDDDGDPIQNVNLQLLGSRYVRGKKQLMPMGAAMTNDLGEYRIHGVSPGRYVLSAIYRTVMMVEATQSNSDSGYAPTYYPSAASPETAAPLEITAGAQMRSVDIRLQRTKTVRIRGTVTNTIGSGSPRGVMLTLQAKADAYLTGFMRNMSRPYNDKGEFVINNVSPGSYYLVAVMQDGNRPATAKVPLEVGNSAIDDVSLVLAPGVEIAGRVKFEGASTSEKTPNLRVFIQPKSSVMFGPQTGEVKQDSTFTVSNIQPDVFDVRVMNLPDGGYVKAIKFGDADITDTGLDFSRGVAPGEITIEIALTAGQVTGQVQNDKSEAAQSAMVVLVPEGSRRSVDRYYAQASTDQYGNYTLRNVTPGDYRVFAFDGVEPGAYQDPEWLKPLESKGEKVSIKESSKESVQLKLISVP